MPEMKFERDEYDLKLISPYWRDKLVKDQSYKKFEALGLVRTG